MNRRFFIQGLIAAPFVHRTGLLLSSQVLLRPEGFVPVDLRQLALLERAYAEGINRLVYPAIVLGPSGNVDWAATRRLQSADAERVAIIADTLKGYPIA